MSPSLSSISHADFEREPAWRVKGDALQEADPELVPAPRNENGQIPLSVGEVWCAADASFADGSHWGAMTLCRGDTSDGPSLWQVWNGTQYVPLVLPPAPEFVLQREGPLPFSAKFGRPLHAIFPLTVKVRPTFEHQPLHRSVIITAEAAEMA